MVDAPLADSSVGESLCGRADGNLALRVCGTEYNGRVVRLASPKCTIGSGKFCTLRLHARGVAPVHCLIVRGATGTAVRRWSRSTRLNGATFIDSPLHAGDRLGLGPLELEVVDDAPHLLASADEAVDAAAPPCESLEDAQREEWERRIAELQAELESARQTLESERNELQARLDALRLDLNAKSSQLAELSARLADAPSAEDLERRASAWEEKRRALHEKLTAAEEAARLAEERAAEWEQAAAQRYTPEGLADREAELRRREEDVERRQEEAEGVLVQTRRRLEELRQREEELWQRDRALTQREEELLQLAPRAASGSDAAENPNAGEEAVSGTLVLPMREMNELSGADSGASPTASASEVLAKLGYTPDWSEESEASPDAVPGAAAPAMESSVDAASPSPPPAETAPEAEDSIEDYMAMLLQRVRGDSRPATGKPAAPRTAPAPAPLAPARPAAQLAAGATVVLGGDSPDVPKISAEEFVPRSPAPERGDRLAAMREVANVSARSAIGRHSQSKWLTDALATGVFALAATAMALYLAFVVGGSPDWHSGAAGAAGIFAVLWTAQAIRQFRHYLRIRREGKGERSRKPAAEQPAASETPAPPASAD